MSKNLRVKWSVVCFLAVVILAPAGFAEDDFIELAQSQESEVAISDEVFAAAARFGDDFAKTSEKPGFIIPNSHGCGTTANLSCNSTTAGTITNHGCVTTDSSSTYFNVYTFNATAGQMVTINARSSAIDPLIVLFSPTATELGRDDDSGDGLDALLTRTLTQTGQHAVAVYANKSGGPATGAFTITLTCSSTTSCTANSTTLCLNNGRFKVQTRWALTDGRNGDGTAVSITGDTGYFWFFDAANIEMVIKVLNACPSRYWVFAGGLTNVQVTMTVTDTARGTVRTYNNPQTTPFQPIQDTNAFATCP